MVKGGLFGIFEIDEKEVKKLGLSKLTEVNWWGPELVKVNARNSFYYDRSKGLKNSLDLVQVHPACLIIREESEVNGRIKSSLKIRGLPNNSLRAIRASHYYMGHPYEQHFNWETFVGNSSYTTEKLTQVAPINFFRIK